MATKQELSRLDEAVSLVTGRGMFEEIGATVHRSHRFPFSEFCKIENLAAEAGMPVSKMINQVLSVGLEALTARLSPAVAKRVGVISDEQMARVMPQSKSAKKSR